MNQVQSVKATSLFVPTKRLLSSTALSETAD